MKRSIEIAGHATSISLEDAFWDALKEVAEEKASSIKALVAEIDTARKGSGLSSAIRVYLLEYYRNAR